MRSISRRNLASLLVCLLGGSLLAGEPKAADYLAFLTPAKRAELFAKGGITDSGSSLGDLGLWRGSPLAARVREIIAERPSTLATEGWFVLEGPAAATTEARDLAIFRSFSSFTTMKGLLARSAVFDRMQSFILDSYRVSSAYHPVRLPDPDEPRAPSSATYVLYGREALVGDVYYELNFLSHKDWFEVSLTNILPLKTLLFTLVQPRELLTLFCVVPTGDKILLYGLAMARMPSIPGIAGFERDSLANRMMALASWFQSNLARSGHEK
jgi:hypothetical protein